MEARSTRSGVRRRQVRAWLRDGLKTLDEEARQAVQMRYVRGMDLDQIAASLGESSSEVRARLQRGNIGLKQVLEEKAGPGTASLLSVALPLLATGTARARTWTRSLLLVAGAAVVAIASLTLLPEEDERVAREAEDVTDESTEDVRVIPSPLTAIVPAAMEGTFPCIRVRLLDADGTPAPPGLTLSVSLVAPRKAGTPGGMLDRRIAVRADGVVLVPVDCAGHFDFTWSLQIGMPEGQTTEPLIGLPVSGPLLDQEIDVGDVVVPLVRFEHTTATAR